MATSAPVPDSFHSTPTQPSPYQGEGEGGGSALVILPGAVGGDASFAQAAVGDREPASAAPSNEETPEPPDESLEFNVELELNHTELRNVTLGQQRHDDTPFSEQEMQLQLSYRPGERFSAMGEIKLIGEQETRLDEIPRNSEEQFVERGETWVYFQRLLDSGFSLQIGRQNFVEPRRWWWDDDLDAVRLHYARGASRYYVGVAEQLARVSSEEDFIDPEEQDVRRVFGYASWRLSEGLTVAAFYLGQDDHSRHPAVDSIIETDREDESDADLRWTGLRAAGDIPLSRGGLLSYWVDAAVVAGDEAFFELEPDVPGSLRVTSIQRHHVEGRAADVGVEWTLPVRFKPSLTLSYAQGSGDKNLTDNTDRAFRQTGLQDRDEEFRYYGELLKPELSNLSVRNISIGFTTFADTRVTLGYHDFRQVYAAPFLRDARIETEPTGRDKDIGDEISLLIQIRDWKDIEIDLAAATFTAGDAFGPEAGKRANSAFFKFVYQF
jgi:hypothetical protein